MFCNSYFIYFNIRYKFFAQILTTNHVKFVNVALIKLIYFLFINNILHILYRYSFTDVSIRKTVFFIFN